MLPNFSRKFGKILKDEKYLLGLREWEAGHSQIVIFLIPFVLTENFKCWCYSLFLPIMLLCVDLEEEEERRKAEPLKSNVQEWLSAMRAESSSTM